MHLCPAQLSHHILHTQTVNINSVRAHHISNTQFPPPVLYDQSSYPISLRCYIFLYHFLQVWGGALSSLSFPQPHTKSLELGKLTADQIVQPRQRQQRQLHRLADNAELLRMCHLMSQLKVSSRKCSCELLHNLPHLLERPTSTLLLFFFRIHVAVLFLIPTEIKGS